MDDLEVSKEGKSAHCQCPELTGPLLGCLSFPGETFVAQGWQGAWAEVEVKRQAGGKWWVSNWLPCLPVESSTLTPNAPIQVETGCHLRLIIHASCHWGKRLKKGIPEDCSQATTLLLHLACVPCLGFNFSLIWHSVFMSMFMCAKDLDDL